MNGEKLCRGSRTRLRLALATSLLLGSVACVCAAMVPVATGASSREAAQVYAERYSVSVATAERWVREQERKTGVRLVDTLNLPEGARLDFYTVRNGGVGGESVRYDGRGRLIRATSDLGRSYKGMLFGLLDGNLRQDALALLNQARDHGFMIVPAALSTPPGVVDTADAEQVTVMVVAVEFPHWVDLCPYENGDGLRDNSMNTDIFYAANAGPLTAPLIYPMGTNAAYHTGGTFANPLPYDDEYFADTPGGRLVNGVPAGLANSTAYSTGLPTATTSIKHPRSGGDSYQPAGALQTAWNNLVFSLANPLSVNRFFNENSHGQIDVSGTTSDIKAWVTDHHSLDRWANPTDPPTKCYYAVQPGTPMLRPTLATVTDPMTGYPYQPIVRASLSASGLTFYFRTDITPVTDITTAGVTLTVWQTQDCDSVAPGVNPATVQIDFNGAAMVGDEWDYRRHTILNPGGNTWRFRDLGNPAQWITYVPTSAPAVPAPPESWRATVALPAAKGGTSTWAANRIGDPDAAPITVPMNPNFRPQLLGCGPLPDTLFTSADVDNSVAGRVEATRKYIGYSVGNRLKSLCYYTHDHKFDPTQSAYQLLTLRQPNGWLDEIGGTVEDPADRVDRPAPFDHDGYDHNFPNHGNVFLGGRHSAAAMRQDVERVLADQGISTVGYDAVFVLYPGADTTGDVENDAAATIIPCAQQIGGTWWAVLPDKAGMRLAAHELGHALGCESLYDRDFDVNLGTVPSPGNFECNGAGPYSLFARGVRIDPWSKLHAGIVNGPWATADPVTADRVAASIARTEGTVALPSIMKLPAHPLAVYATKNPTAPVGFPGGQPAWDDLRNPESWQEYFLLENRSTTGASYFNDTSSPGLYIWHIDERDIGGFQRNEGALTVVPEQADGRIELQSNSRDSGPGDTAGDPFPGSVGNRSFTQRSALLGNGQQSPTSWSHGAPNGGNTDVLGGTPTDSFVRLTSISNPGAVMTANVYVEPAEVIVTSEDLVPAPDAGKSVREVPQGATGYPMLEVTLNNDGVYPNLSTDDVTIQTISVDTYAGLNADARLSSVKLYEDQNYNKQIDAGEPLLRTSSVSSGVATFGGLGYSVPLGSVKHLLVACDVSTAAPAGAVNLRACLAGGASVVPTVPGTVQLKARLASGPAAPGYNFGADRFPCESSAIQIVDGLPPFLSNTLPASPAAVDSPISFTVEDTGDGVDETTLQARIVVTHRDTTQTTQDLTGLLTKNTADMPAKLHCSWTPPAGFLKWNDQATVYVSCKDRSAPTHDLVDGSYSFNVVPDTTGPSVTNASPAIGATGILITSPITFTITDDVSGVDVSTLHIFVGGVEVTSECAIDSANLLAVTVRYPSTGPGALSWNSTVQMKVQVSDRAANPTNPPANEATWSFDTDTDVTGPAVTSILPAPGATNQALDATVGCRLVDTKAGVDWSTLEVYLNGTQAMAPDLTYDTATGVIRVAHAAFGYGQACSVRVKVRDVLGNLISDESPVITAGDGFEWQFTCVPEPTYRVSGRVTQAATPDEGVPAVTVTAYVDEPGGAAAGSGLTDGYGNYVISGLKAGAYRIVPSLAEADFTPPQRSVTIANADVTGQDFTTTIRTYTISGQVTADGTGLAGVTVSDGFRTVTTDAQGNYTLAGVPAGKYTVRPAMPYYDFQPEKTVVTIPVPGANVTGISFDGIAQKFTIVGTVRDYDGNRVQGATVTAGPQTATTNDLGVFTLVDVRPGTFPVQVVKTGYKMSPSVQNITVPPSATGVDFTAYLAYANTFPVGVNFLGLPCTPESDDPTLVFGTTTVARWNPSLTVPGYVMPGATEGAEILAMRPGRGYFVNLPQADLSVGGRPVGSSRAFSLNLGPVWNMTANMFNSPLPFANIIAAVPGSVRPFGYVYQATAPRGYLLIAATPGVNVARTVIHPWEGVWLRTDGNPATINVTPPQVGSTDAQAAPQELSLGVKGWSATIVAKAADSQDVTTTVGVGPSLAAGVQFENPPMAPQSVDVYLTAADGRYLSQDIKAGAVTTQSWDFSVVSDIPNTSIALSLPDLSKVPGSLAVYLTDLSTGKRLYARTLTSYSFESGDAGVQRRFRLEVSPKSAAGLVVSGAAARGVGQGLAITYNVSADCQTTVTITNIAGRVIRTLGSGQVATKGANSLGWDLRSTAGTPVPNGRYLVRVEAVGEDGQQVSVVTSAVVSR